MLHNQQNADSWWPVPQQSFPFITHSASAALIAYTSHSSLICVFMFSDSLTLICIVAQSCKGGVTKKQLHPKANCIHHSNKVIIVNGLVETILHTYSTLDSWKRNHFSCELRKIRIWHYQRQSAWKHFCVDLELVRDNISSAAGLFCVLARRSLMRFERNCLKY